MEDTDKEEDELKEEPKCLSNAEPDNSDEPLEEGD